MDQKATQSTAQVPPGCHPSALYHVYHTGYHSTSYSLHTISDSNTTLKSHTPSFLSSPSLKRQGTAPLPLVRRTTTTLSTALSKAERAKRLDDPKFDPRCSDGSSPYFVHLPTLAFNSPPYTLRQGGTKRAPCVCLMHSSLGWRSWKLEFVSEVGIGEEGIMDGRGVVSLKHGTEHGEGGTLRGYRVRKLRFWGESGKSWHQKWRLAVKFHEKGRRKEGKEGVKPEEVILLKWTKPFSFHTREYRFSWRGFEFVWKGTRKEDTSLKRVFRRFLRLCHLKLVVLIPGKGGNEGEREKEAVLARFTSVVSKRKVGRLEVFEEVLDGFVDEELLGRGGAEEKEGGDRVKSGEKEKLKQRLRDVVVGTGMCMVIGEWRKRQVVIGIIVDILDNIP